MIRKTMALALLASLFLSPTRANLVRNHCPGCSNTGSILGFSDFGQAMQVDLGFQGAFSYNSPDFGNGTIGISDGDDDFSWYGEKQFHSSWSEVLNCDGVNQYSHLYKLCVTVDAGWGITVYLFEWARDWNTEGWPMTWTPVFGGDYNQTGLILNCYNDPVWTGTVPNVYTNYEISNSSFAIHNPGRPGGE